MSASTPSDAPARSVASLLALLDAGLDVPARPRDLLIDVTVARVLRAGRRDVAGRLTHLVTGAAIDGAVPLSAHDASEFDALVDQSWQPPLAAGAPAAHSSKLANLCTLIDAPLAHEAPSHRSQRIDRLMALVQQAPRQTADHRSDAAPQLQPALHAAPSHDDGPWRMDPAAANEFRSQRRLRLADLASIAAILVIGVAMFWPILSMASNQSRELACAANLSRVAQGMGSYAMDYGGRLPQARASFLGGVWWDVGTPERSHSANLYRLVSRGYASLAELACSGNPHAPTIRTDPQEQDWRSIQEVSYSYQLLSPGRPRWDTGRTFLVLTDKSPVVSRARRGEFAEPSSTSDNHRGRGQSLLMSDGSARFVSSPVLENGDNIWVPGNGGRLQSGREMPESDLDAFVGP